MVTDKVKLKKHILNNAPQVFDGSLASTINDGVYTGTPIRLPYPGEAGQRNNFRGDGFFNVDSSLDKTWNLAELGKLKFAWEVYNVTNTPRFDVATIESSLTRAGLGYSSSMLTQYRHMQFGLRFDFYELHGTSTAGRSKLRGLLPFTETGWLLAYFPAAGPSAPSAFSRICASR